MKCDGCDRTLEIDRALEIFKYLMIFKPFFGASLFQDGKESIMEYGQLIMSLIDPRSEIDLFNEGLHGQ